MSDAQAQRRVVRHKVDKREIFIGIEHGNPRPILKSKAIICPFIARLVRSSRMVQIMKYDLSNKVIARLKNNESPIAK